MEILTPPNESIALSAIRSAFKAPSKLSDVEKAQKAALETAERCGWRPKKAKSVSISSRSARPSYT